MRKRVKKGISLLLCLLLCISLLPGSAFAEDETGTESELIAEQPETSDSSEGNVAIDESNFPDAAFREYISTNHDTDSDGVLSPEEIANVTELYCYYLDMTSLEGIGYFTNLVRLFCHGNQLTELDVSQNTALEYLNCAINQLTALDVSKNTALQYLVCEENQLTELDVSENSALKGLGFENNQLTELDVSQNTELEELYCTYNQLTELDVSNNEKLFRLDCGFNQLTELDVSNNKNLIRLGCESNQLSELELKDFTALEILYCFSNQLTKLELGNNTSLRWLSCGSNQLTELDISDAVSLTELTCVNNHLTALDLSNNTNLIGSPYCDGQTAAVKDITRSGEKYLVDLSVLVGAENTGKITSVENGDYDAETGIASLDTLDSFTYYYDTGCNDTLMDVTCEAAGLEKLATPTNLKYGFEYECQYDENGNYTGYETTEAPGMISWCTEGPTQNEFRVAIYKVGEETPVWRVNWDYTGSEDRAYSVFDFINMDPESGEYYFAVTALGDLTQYRDSDTAVSETWTYVKPELSLGQCSTPVIDGQNVSFLLPEDLSYVGGEIMEIYYSPTADMANMELVGETYNFSREGVSAREGSAYIYDEAIQDWGPGYYSVRVRALSCDINAACNGPWSEMSDPIRITDVVEDVDSILQGIEEEEEPTAEVVREQVQELNTEALKTAMLADNDDSGVNSSLQALEEYTGGTVVEVTDAMADSFDAETVGVIGASLNTVQDSEQPVKLIVDQAKEEDVIPELYDNTVAVRFALELENVDATQLEVPVKVTLPIPASINPDFLVILHYHVSGEAPEEIQPYVFQQDGQYYASFVVTSFSDFVMTMPAEEVERLPGDMNGDGKVNTMDLIRLMKSINGEEVEMVEGAGDVNGDGKINTMDLIRLMKYINGEVI